MKTACIAGELDRPIQSGQRRALFAAARRHGFDLDALRSLTPAGSISALTVRQASELLDRLNAGTPGAAAYARRRIPRRREGVVRMVTPAQRLAIDALREALGWSAEKLGEFLSARHYTHGGTMDVMQTTRDAGEVMALLRHVVAGTRRAIARRQQAESTGETTHRRSRLPRSAASAGPPGTPADDGLAVPGDTQRLAHSGQPAGAEDIR